MATTVTTNPPPRNVSASLGTSDNSAGGLFWRRNGQRGEENQPRKIRAKSFFEGSVPAETWGIYADLAGLMNALCLLQTQSSFLTQAKSAVERLERLFKHPEAGGNEFDETATTAELAVFIADVLHKTQHKTISNNDESATNPLAHGPAKQLQSDVLDHCTDWSKFSDLIQNRLNLLENEQEHLLGLAQSARLRIEKTNHSCVNTEQENLSDATNRTLHELNSQSFNAFQSQTVRLPKKVLCLINN